jgi:hypothetical protein
MAPDRQKEERVMPIKDLAAMRARPTIYNGVQMRSRLEATLAGWFDRNAIPWAYEPGCFANETGQYLPDFRLDGFAVGGGNKRPIYVEVKPTLELADAAKRRMEIIWSSEPNADLLIVAPCYVLFRFGANAPMSVLREDWVKPDDEWTRYVEFNRCGYCDTVTLTHLEGPYFCSRCGEWGSNHRGREFAPAVPGPLSCESCRAGEATP